MDKPEKREVEIKQVEPPKNQWEQTLHELSKKTKVQQRYIHMFTESPGPSQCPTLGAGCHECPECNRCAAHYHGCYTEDDNVLVYFCPVRDYWAFQGEKPVRQKYKDYPLWKERVHLLEAQKRFWGLIEDE